MIVMKITIKTTIISTMIDINIASMIVVKTRSKKHHEHMGVARIATIV
jgi:hypothetical protein